MLTVAVPRTAPGGTMLARQDPRRDRHAAPRGRALPWAPAPQKNDAGAADGLGKRLRRHRILPPTQIRLYAPSGGGHKHHIKRQYGNDLSPRSAKIPYRCTVCTTARNDMRASDVAISSALVFDFICVSRIEKLPLSFKAIVASFTLNPRS